MYICVILGILMLKKSLSEGTNSEYDMTVTAYDSGNPRKSVDVRVSITVQRNEFPPVFVNGPYSQTVSENIRNGTGIFTILATDEDLQGELTYEVIGLSPAPNFFHVHPTEGTVWVINDLTGDRALTYTLRIGVYDSSSPEEKVFTEMNIHVNRNEYTPEFSEDTYTKTILANIELGTVVLRVSATDNDRDDSLQYTLTSDSSCQEYFYMNPDTGAISLKRMLSEVPVSFFRCEVFVSDQGYPTENTDRANLQISVTRDVELPSFTRELYTGEVSESASVGTTITRVQANIPVIVGVVVYDVTGLYPAPDFFDVGENTGVITVKRDLRLDSLKLNSYNLQLIAFDSVTPNMRGTTEVAITVTRSINNPVFTQNEYSATTTINQALGETIVTVSANDADGDAIFYELIGDDKALDYFFVNPSTGEISLKSPINLDNSIEYLLRVKASDNPAESEQMSTVQVRIYVARDEIRPRFNGPYRLTIDENLAVNKSVTTVRATDGDQSGEMTYEIVGVYPAETFFWINSRSGTIYIRNSLSSDSLKTATYRVRVAAFDSHFPMTRVTEDVEISVTRNPSPPSFSQRNYRTSISEMFPAGDNIIQFTATDPDGDLVFYSLEGQESTISFFYLNPFDGTLTLRRSLVGSTQSSFSFSVRATDQQGSQSRSSDVSVSIEITRDQEPPQFVGAPYFVEVSENKGVNQTVTQIVATDPDLQGRLQYEVRGVAPGTNFFYIDTDSGNIYVRAPLNMETDTRYTLIVVVWDSGNPNIEVSTQVSITVKRNEYAPQFFPRTVSVQLSEHAAVGTNITRVHATDDDLEGLKSQITYSVIGDNAAPTYFFIHPSNGDIFIAKSLTLDSQASRQHLLRVVARDQGTPQQTGIATISVSVERNSYSPVFQNPSSYQQTIADTFTPGFTVMTVEATDNDLEGPNSDIVYSLIGDGMGREYFAIDSHSGSINLRQPLDSAGIAMYSMQVQACDKGVPPKCTEAEATVSITTDDNFPQFEQTQYDITLKEDSEITLSIVKLSAEDADCPVKYSITGDGLATTLFDVGEDSGIITLAQSFAVDTGTLYTIRAVAYDSCNPVQKAVAFVRVTVVRNENTPVFERSRYSATVDETQNIGANVVQVQAVDSDVVSEIYLSSSNEYVI